MPSETWFHQSSFSNEAADEHYIQALKDKVRKYVTIEGIAIGTTDVDDDGIRPDLVDVCKKHFAFALGATDKDEKFHPVEDKFVQEQDDIKIGLDKMEGQPESSNSMKMLSAMSVSMMKGKQLELDLAKEVDDHFVNQQPVACEEHHLQSLSLSGSLQETSTVRNGLLVMYPIMSWPVACHVNKQKKVTYSSSKASRSAKKRKRKKEHFLHVPKLIKTKKNIKKTPQSTGDKSDTNTGIKNEKSQIANTTVRRNYGIIENEARKNVDGCGGGDSDDHRSQKKKLPDDKIICEDEDMNTDNNNSVSKMSMSSSIGSVQVDMPVIAQEESGSEEFEQVNPVREAWDRVQQQQQQIYEGAIEKVKQEVKSKTYIAFSELSHDCQRFTEMVRQGVIHTAYCQTEGCPQRQICTKIKNEWIPHFNNPQQSHAIINQQTCLLCKCINIALYMHHMGCQDPDHCDVWKCAEIKQSINDAARKRQLAKGTILYSTTSIWKEGQVAFEDEDYVFLVKKPIGHGTFGNVHRAWIFDHRTSCEADVALKETQYNMKNEANVMKILGNNHPCILQTQAIISLDNRTHSGYVIMELCECSLLDYLYDYIVSNNKSGLPLADAIYFFVQVVDGVAYMHSKKVVHKDLKARNIFMTHNCQRIKIGDWDAAMFLKDELTQGNLRPQGTAGYAAPEVVSRKPHGFSADIFSLGCCLLELLFGHQHEATPKSRQKNIESLAIEDKELAMLVIQCLSDDPKERPTAKDIFCHPAINKYLNGNIPTPPEAFRMAGKHMKNDKMLKAGMEEFCCPAALRETAAKLHGQTDDSLLGIMDQLPKELPDTCGPTTSSWDIVTEESMEN